MKTVHNGIEIDDDLGRVDVDLIHCWLTETYWSPGVTRALVEQAARASTIVIGAYADGVQVGYARVISDTVRFAYLADVYVDDSQRGKGLGRAIVKFAIEHPLLSVVPLITLKTRDAHGVYEGVGFGKLQKPELWMEMRR